MTSTSAVFLHFGHGEEVLFHHRERQVVRCDIRLYLCIEFTLECDEVRSVGRGLNDGTDRDNIGFREPHAQQVAHDVPAGRQVGLVHEDGDLALRVRDGGEARERIDGLQRQREEEAAPFAYFALKCQLPAEIINVLGADGEAETGAAEGGGRLLRCLLESFEDRLLVLFGDPDSRIGYRYTYRTGALVVTNGQLDGFPGRGELVGVRDEVHDDPFELGGIDGDLLGECGVDVDEVAERLVRHVRRKRYRRYRRRTSPG